jgi:hypothetical protein
MWTVHTGAAGLWRRDRAARHQPWAMGANIGGLEGGQQLGAVKQRQPAAIHSIVWFGQGVHCVLQEQDLAARLCGSCGKHPSLLRHMISSAPPQNESVTSMPETAPYSLRSVPVSIMCAPMPHPTPQKS